MTNPNDPIQCLAVAPDGDVARVVVQHLGLTKREDFAARAMQAIIASGCHFDAAEALRYADALIKELNQTEVPA